MRDNAILPPTASGDGAGARFVSTDAGPTASGDGAGERFCASLPLSPQSQGQKFLSSQGPKENLLPGSRKR